MKPNPWLTHIVLLVTVFALSGAPAVAQSASAPSGQQQAEPTPNLSNGQVDPTAGPKTPLPSSDFPENPQPSEETAPAALPPAPSATNAQSSSSPSSQPKTPQQPLGTAAARRGATAGGPASEPAGMAIAPAKQKQTRSLLLKIGAIAAAGAAIGIVYGLTRATPSTPPNSGAATNR